MASAIDLSTVFEEKDLPERPGALEKSATGARWELQDESFSRWWKALVDEDRYEFGYIYKGDITLARFVCALDYLTTMQARPQSGNTMVEAYAIAAHLPSDSEAARRGAVAAWQHDSVQALMDRLRYRSARQASARITNRATALIETMLAEATAPGVELKDKERAVRSALAFMKMVSDEDVQERVERTKRGFVKARQELDASQAELEKITPDQARIHLKLMEDSLGTEELREIIRALNP